MTYDLYILAPEDVLTSDGELIERDITLPIEDILAYPTFTWYPGLCVCAVGFAQPDYVGIFNDTSCVDVTWSSRVFKQLDTTTNEHDFIRLWRYETDVVKIAFAIRNIINLETMKDLSQSIIQIVIARVESQHLGIPQAIQWMDDVEFNRLIVRLTLFRDDRYADETIDYRAYTAFVYAL